MKVVFGIHLDGERSWHRQHAFNTLVLGPSGLLSQLELYLGLSSPRPGKIARIIDYLQALKHCDDGERFFSRSLRVDEFGVAAALLTWRDELYLHGWSGEFRHQPAAGRLRDLADVERQLRGSGFSPGNGERLVTVLRSLEHLRVPVTELRLLEPLERHPLRWQQVIRCLNGTHVPLWAEPQAPPGSQLCYLQQQLTGQGDGSDAPPADGSITVVTADTALQAAAYTASRMHQADGGGLLLVHGGRAGLLDHVLTSAGYPRQGAFELNPARPALQLLPLLVRLAWAPLDAEALLALLTLPRDINPLHPELSRQLAVVVARQPGIGGEEWRKVLERFAASHDDAALKDLDTWIPGPCSGAEQGLSVTELSRRANAVRDFFSCRAEEAEDESDRALVNACREGEEQAAAFGGAIDRLATRDVPALTRYQIDQLLAAASERGSTRALQVREAGCAADAGHPGAVCTTGDRTIWWWASSPPVEQAGVWSADERLVLEREGVRLPSQDERLGWQADDWLRPVLASRDSFTLVLPPEGEERHPLWQAISAILPGLNVLPLEECDHPAGAGMVHIDHRPLPAALPFRDLGRSVSIGRHTFSATSLEKLLQSPAAWFLEYIARFTPSRASGINDGPRLSGLLAHRLVQRLCRDLQDSRVSSVSFDTWYEQAWPRLVAEEGATLLMAGRRGEYEWARARIRQALGSLLPLLEELGDAGVVSEKVLEGHIDDCRLKGYVDLLLESGRDGPLVIDMKWAGRTERRRELADGRYLQLLVYASLARQAYGRWPGLAYYILDGAQLLSASHRFSRYASFVRPTGAEPDSVLWERVLVSFRWRKEQLERGLLAAGLASGPDAHEALCMPQDGLQIKPRNPSWNPYRYVAGWEACS
ncbi:PD-(D/E)XK nuclease family protein [Prosthecochloris sp. N3]|uniref:PD-(D/E)XK nuclease family protein n=1 Tax=Prosthecochloris ethylica TaxID=2743976 RepID=A0ABR9XT28_9CHLB|nr:MULTISPECIES: PD-(D/E)XK nuclease family protein [Prosthecochloris]MBF0586950.1 PD-(D/E)XK nuclease family protein [Prosthecochloris ethylica]MBF0637173.1 PD-(D/E)XK nuclease family protein [Prosthecochloris ethylica]NUK48181.1 PD-(D/E)XK nuclease family protein [Prosthecochloris ethylica]RNA64879.1 hypothetical protein CR163_006330 [Prosthecochloris sp. ZM_2]